MPRGLLSKLERMRIQEEIVKPLFFTSLPLLFIILFLSIMRTSLFPEETGEEHMIFEIVFLFLLAILARSVVTYLRQPTVVILMLLGVIMGPSFLEMAWAPLSEALPFLPSSHPDVFLHEELIDIFAQFGAIILMFKVGLHSSISKIFTRENFLVAILGIIFPFIAGYLFAISSGGSFFYALFLGAALTATSVGVTVAILKEMGLLEEKFSQMIMGAAIIDDILSLLVLSLVTNLPSSLDAAALEPFVSVIIYAVIFLAGGSLVGRYFVRKKVDIMKITEKTLLYVFAFVFLYAYIAEFIGLSSIVGAFLAGVLLNYSRNADEISEQSRSLELLFTPVFFISLGMLVDIGAVLSFIWPILILSAVAIATKVAACGLGALASGLGKAESMIVGFGMAPRGEIALIIAVFGLSSGALSVSEYSVISAMAFLTTIAVPFVFSAMIQKPCELRRGAPA
jgi:Kef-type K+ transport system membrane component KefB